MLLAACGTQPPVVERSPSATSETVKTTPKAPRKLVPTRRGGGYYKDDGPADEIPDNLDDIPDATPRAEPLHRFANKPYVALGRSYVPNTRVQPLHETGIASWYGRKFHGQRTSIGEPYDMFSMTAAHPTLAIPSYVRVTSVRNGRSVIVRVIDRGPFHVGRVIDLSYAAAWKLGIIDDGSGQVEVDAIVPDEGGFPPLRPSLALGGSAASHTDGATASSGTPTLRSEPDEIEALSRQFALGDSASTGAGNAGVELRGVFLQLGAFSSADNAESLRAHLTRELDWVGEPLRVVAANGMYRVHLGPYASRADAERNAERIRQTLGFKPSFVIR
ncbi:septal ring lytic transglycosylase RlpA family protein [Rhodocyclus tenuis]|uniref:Endolytic peptidoglycan transglycosylase RlpA n=2 Tax=Rhodocyclus TaxID=1064 RepID=A0A6L5JX86_RHOTE|nr:septal ring lytic transglycosylase RlpA family protein [Rhodocyclus gracilis]MQY51829.1 septal ring lytic transglycosylase RlpA family protein [Rhodocyclus gracilis]MRD73482.1 septal ring lytic transglycosylase RlpA family protein [Rhodocyclus gracilis]NJA88408.1 septal ring lytic transglycosylase RlpA family protein [Rhodocyclus gracilis]